MIVADSSLLVYGVLRDASLLASDSIITLDLALHEVANSIWKHVILESEKGCGVRASKCNVTWKTETTNCTSASFQTQMIEYANMHRTYIPATHDNRA